MKFFVNVNSELQVISVRAAVSAAGVDGDFRVDVRPGQKWKGKTYSELLVHGNGELELES